MALTRLTKHDKNTAIDLLSNSFDVASLEQMLSWHDAYLGVQEILLATPKSSVKNRIAGLLLNILGDQLVQQKDIRVALANKKHIQAPKSWRPGSKNAIDFVTKLGLSVAFAGIQPIATPDPAEELVAACSLPELFDYQKEVVCKANKTLDNGDSVLISIPTGGGKTRTSIELLLHRLSIKSQTCIFWIAHTEELCMQASECIRQVWASRGQIHNAAIIRLWGGNAAKLINGEIYQATDLLTHMSYKHVFVVGTPKSALNLIENSKQLTWSSILNRQVILLFDEAHRAATPSYRAVLNAVCKKSQTPPEIIGLSATPVRFDYKNSLHSGTKQLSKLFKKLIEPIDTLGGDISPTIALQKKGVLAKLNVKQLPSHHNSMLKLSEQIDKIRNGLSNKQPSLVFTSRVSDSLVLAAHLSEKGLLAESVSSQTTTSDRAGIISAMYNGNIEVLCNCELLTTGFDAPAISEIFLARETNSPVLYKQIIGRGLRGPAIGGNETCQLYLCGIKLPFESYDPNTHEFARYIWNRF